MHDSFDWLVATIRESICLILTIGWLHPYLRSQFICTLLWMIASMPHVHVSEISIVLVLVGLLIVVFG